MAPFELAGGRELPPLLFATNKAALGSFEGGITLSDLNELIPDPHRVAVVPETGSVEEIAQTVREAASHDPEPAGVVLLGGYETLPARLIRAISEQLAPVVSVNDDGDHYIAWNDDLYGDFDGVGLPKVPVSRIPARVDLRRALRAAPPADPPERRTWRALRIERFAYAAPLYQSLPQSDTSPMLSYGPLTADDVAREIAQQGLAANWTYFACHGDYAKSSIFHTFDGKTVFRANQVPDADGAVVVAACCHSAALTNIGPLGAATDDKPRPPSLPKAKSIAVSYIDRGAKAYIGSTAWLWIPVKTPFDHYSAPLHRAFWRNVTERDLPPARALFEAKADYVLNMPYANPEIDAGEVSAEASIARHLKNYWSTTCLGLGW